jgi:hypothetical protein
VVRPSHKDPYFSPRPLHGNRAAAIIHGVKNPEAIAAIASALRNTYGDEQARVLLSDGVSLAAIIEAVLSLPVANNVSVRMIAKALESGDLIVTPEVGPLWHVRYVYERPGSMNVVDMLMLTPDRTFSSAEILLRLVVPEQPPPEA